MLGVSVQQFSFPSNKAGHRQLLTVNFCSQTSVGAQMTYWYDNKMKVEFQLKPIYALDINLAKKLNIRLKKKKIEARR